MWGYYYNGSVYLHFSERPPIKIEKFLISYEIEEKWIPYLSEGKMEFEMISDKGYCIPVWKWNKIR